MTQSIKDLDIFSRRDHGTKYRLLACEVAHRECCYAAAVSRNVIDLHFLSQGLHDLESATMCARIQAEVDASAAGRYGAILLGFGLCNTGLVGLRAREVPLVLPRAHDCITLFLGSKETYQRHFEENKGTFFLTTGWVERDKENLESTREDASNIMHRMGLDRSFEEYVALYGEEYARMIIQTVGGLEHYQQITHIEMGLAPQAEERAGEAMRSEAERRGWRYEVLAGRMELFLALVNGEWDEERFLVVAPGQTIRQAYDERIVQAAEEAHQA